jgi:hypothetical protein
MNFSSVKSEQSFASVILTLGGDAVYKARSLNALFYPAEQYNDRVKCVQSTGQNKTTNAFDVVTNLDSLYEVQTNTEASILKEQIDKNSSIVYENNSINNTFNIYPNPAKDIINIKYNELTNGTFYLYNVLGQDVLQVQLSAGNRLVIVPINDIAAGVYSYKIDFKGKLYNGKIKINK